MDVLTGLKRSSSLAGTFLRYMNTRVTDLMTVDPLFVPAGLQTRLDQQVQQDQQDQHDQQDNGPTRTRHTRTALLAELSLVHLYTAACLYQWDSLPSLAAQVHACTPLDLDATARVQATVRHMVVFCGYGPCLAAMTALKKVDDELLQRTIPHDTPGKISSSIGVDGGDKGGDNGGGSPPDGPGHILQSNEHKRGNAFQLVYSTLSPKVRNTVYQADPVLENWIQNHLYGDVYSSPGLSMLSKQHLTIAGLVKSNMMEQLYGHALAALRFGGDEHVLKGIVDIVVWWQKKVEQQRDGVDDDERGAMTPGAFRELDRQGAKSKRVVDMAMAKYKRMKEDGELETDDVVVNPPGTVCIPSLAQIDR
mmetsp:Transcript_8633/g.23428  ORF Transcript_8633/g.23428 Transcript_8633/m.23428 type:complete len:364 (-) Transcript_8633:585-1676(-)